VGALPIRIVSDVHFAERASRVRSLGELRPLTEGVSLLVFNGDMMDTRPGPDDRRTARIRSMANANPARYSVTNLEEAEFVRSRW